MFGTGFFNFTAVSRGFIKDWEPGKLIGCEVNFAHLVCASRGKLVLKRSSTNFTRF